MADNQGKTAAVYGVFFGDIYCGVGVAEVDFDFVGDNAVVVIGNFDTVGSIYTD